MSAQLEVFFIYQFDFGSWFEPDPPNPFAEVRRKRSKNRTEPDFGSTNMLVQQERMDPLAHHAQRPRFIPSFI